MIRLVNKPKRQGTRFETAIVDIANSFGFEAERLAEGGMHDLGDVRILGHTDDWIIEAKHRERLKIHEEVQKARGKARNGGAWSAVIWKRSTRKKGNKQRSQVGVPIVCMDVETFFNLIGGTIE